jgi:tetratricopeptide (TPR) repeat protein
MYVAQEYEKVREFQRKPGYQMQLRHALYTIHKLEQLKQNERKVELTRFANESHFLLRRTIDPGFYRFVKKRELKRKNWYWNQVRELGYLILLDVFHPEKATPTRAARKSKSISESWVTERHLRRVRRNYPELFFTPPKETGRKTNDEREIRYSTVFTDMSGVDKSGWRAAAELLATMDLARLPYRGRIHEIRALHAALRMVDPDDIIGLERFWERQKASLKIIEYQFGNATHEEWLIHHIEKGSRVLETIYQLIDDAVALRWYRTIKSEVKKVRLLRERHPLSYSRVDAKTAVEQTFKWCEDPVRAVDLVLRGASAYSKLKYKIVLRLYEECLKQPIEEEDRGLCLHNMAWNYRMMGKPRKYLIGLKKALNTFENFKSSFDTGITWAFVAEAYHLLKYRVKYNEAIQQSKSILSQSNLEDTKLAKAYLPVADCAMRTGNHAWEREAVVSGLKASSKLEDLEYFLYYNQRLTDLDAGKPTPYAEMEPGKLRRPPVFRWYVEGSELFVPLSPSRLTHKDARAS